MAGGRVAPEEVIHKSRQRERTQLPTRPAFSFTNIIVLGDLYREFFDHARIIDRNPGGWEVEQQLHRCCFERKQRQQKWLWAHKSFMLSMDLCDRPQEQQNTHLAITAEEPETGDNALYLLLWAGVLFHSHQTSYYIRLFSA